MSLREPSQNQKMEKNLIFNFKPPLLENPLFDLITICNDTKGYKNFGDTKGIKVCHEPLRGIRIIRLIGWELSV